MDNLKWDEWIDCLETIELIYDKEWPDKKIHKFYDLVSRLPGVYVKSAVDHHCRTSPFPPRPSDIIDYAKSMLVTGWEVAFAKAIKNAHYFQYPLHIRGEKVEPRWSDDDVENEIIAQTVERFGGIGAIRDMRENDGMARAHFRDIYNNVISQIERKGFDSLTSAAGPSRKIQPGDKVVPIDGLRSIGRRIPND